MTSNLPSLTINCLLAEDHDLQHTQVKDHNIQVKQDDLQLSHVDLKHQGLRNMTSNLPRLSIMTGMANAIQEAKVRPVLGPNF
jgi:hypothetical protein